MVHPWGTVLTCLQSERWQSSSHAADMLAGLLHIAHPAHEPQPPPQALPPSPHTPPPSRFAPPPSPDRFYETESSPSPPPPPLRLPGSASRTPCSPPPAAT